MILLTSFVNRYIDSFSLDNNRFFFFPKIFFHIITNKQNIPVIFYYRCIIFLVSSVKNSFQIYIYNVRNKKMLIENIYIIHKNLPSVSTKTVETVNMVNVSKFQLKTVARQYWQLSLLIAY